MPWVGEGMSVFRSTGLKELIFNSCTLGECGGLDRIDFSQFLLWEHVVALKELIFNSFYFGRV